MATSHSPQTSARSRVSEKTIYESCVNLYRLAGCRVKRFSQARAARQTPGIPDLKVFAPRVHQAWWHETKTPTGRLSAEQIAFRQEAEACGERFVVGGVEAAWAQLQAAGLARQEEGRFVLVPGGMRVLGDSA